MRKWVERGELPYEVGVHDPKASRYRSADDRAESSLLPEDETERAYARKIWMFQLCFLTNTRPGVNNSLTRCARSLVGGGNGIK
jgi:hypothetical protein